MTAPAQTPAHPKENWLVISHAFNMDGRAASHTITDKIPFLLQAGINPIIISAATGHKDKQLEHHQLLPAAPSGLKFDLRHVLRKKYQNRPLTHKAVKGAVMLGLLPFYGIERALIHRESQWSWYLPAYRRGLKLIRERGDIKVIFTTGGANSAHYAGYLLARKTGLPWIAELHDPMIHNAWNGTKMAYNQAKKIETLVCRHADLAWWFTGNALNRAGQRNPELGNKGILVLPGAESPDFGDAAYKRTATFNIGHFGSLSSESRNFKIFFQAVRELLDEKGLDPAKIRINIYGTGLDGTSLQAMDDFRMQGVAIAHGRLEIDPVTGKSGRQRVVEAMRESDILLLLHGADAFCEEYIPSKLYEYLWTQRPILGLTWNNETLDGILKESGHPAVRSTDIPAIKRELLALYRRWENGDLQDNGKASAYTTQKAVAQILEATRALSPKSANAK